MRRIETLALLVRAVPMGESDLVVTFFTEVEGNVPAMVRGARRSQKRFGGALEPIHGLDLRLTDRGKELCTLDEARIAVPRTGITGDLARMDAAGHALRWVRHLCPPRTPEPAVWHGLVALLDALDRLGGPGLGGGLTIAPVQHLVAFGLRLLAAMGYALDLAQCVSCGKACPSGRPAFVDAARGGLVCMTCGGARRTISAELREAALSLASSPRGPAPAQPGDRVLSATEASELVDLVEGAMVAHASFESATSATSPTRPGRGVIKVGSAGNGNRSGGRESR